VFVVQDNIMSYRAVSLLLSMLLVIQYRDYTTDIYGTDCCNTKLCYLHKQMALAG